MSGAPDYPPEPWRLAGQGYLSVWRVPVAELPRIPAGLRPITVSVRAMVVTARIAYRELLAAVAVRNGLKTTATITESGSTARSRSPGAGSCGASEGTSDFDLRHGRAFTGSAVTADDWIATAAFTIRGGAPVATGSTFSIAQQIGNSVRYSRVRAKARPRAAVANWNINPEDPLGYLTGRTPLLSLHTRDFHLRFGG